VQRQQSNMMKAWLLIRLSGGTGIVAVITRVTKRRIEEARFNAGMDGPKVPYAIMNY